MMAQDGLARPKVRLAKDSVLTLRLISCDCRYSFSLASKAASRADGLVSAADMVCYRGKDVRGGWRFCWSSVTIKNNAGYVLREQGFAGIQFVGGSCVDRRAMFGIIIGLGKW